MKLIKRFSSIFYILLFLSTAANAIDKLPPGTNGTGKLTGIVTDKASGTTIPGATVSIPDLRTGTSTNASGKYTLSNLPKGVYLVSVTFVGYAAYTQKVDFSINNIKCCVFGVINRRS